MKIELVDIIGYLALYLGITATLLIDLSDGLSFCNPRYLKERHPKLNIVGVVILTIIYNVIWLPYAILYWLYKVITLWIY